MAIGMIEGSRALCSWQHKNEEFKSSWYEPSALVNVEGESFGKKETSIPRF